MKAGEIMPMRNIAGKLIAGGYLILGMLVVVVTGYLAVQGNSSSVMFLVTGSPNYFDEISSKHEVVSKVGDFYGAGIDSQEIVDYLHLESEMGNPWAVYFHYEITLSESLLKCRCSSGDLPIGDKNDLKKILIYGVGNPVGYGKDIVMERILSSALFSDKEKMKFRNMLDKYEANPANSAYHDLKISGTLAESILLSIAYWRIDPWNLELLKRAFA